MRTKDAVTIMIVSVVGIVMLAAGRIPADKPVNWAAVRAYRISQFDDNQLLKLKEWSQTEYEKRKAAVAEDGNRWWAERQREAKECEASPDRKLRDPDHCYKPLPIGFEDIGKPRAGDESPERIFEDAILGRCIFFKTEREAIAENCLASSP